jgi:cell division protein FtsZ
MFEIIGNNSQQAVIKVIGVGGGGGNAVEHMLGGNIEGVEFVCANTDAQALKKLGVSTILQLGNDITKGLGAGADPEIGRQSAEADAEEIRRVLEGTDMAFITAGMGGGTGTGAAPVVAKIAREMGILTVAVVTRPFSFEGKKRMKIAQDGIEDLTQYVDSLITIPNDKLLSVLGKKVSLLNAFKAANNVLLGAVQGIAELITRPGLINVDFADVRTVMSEMGMAMMGSGVAKGENRAREAAEAAIASPLLEDVDLSGAQGVLVNVTAGLDVTIGEFEEVGEIVKKYTSENATVVVGTVIDSELKDEVRVTIVLTGLGNPVKRTNTNSVATFTASTLAAAATATISALSSVTPPAYTTEKTEETTETSSTETPIQDYALLDKPTMVRQQQSFQSGFKPKIVAGDSDDDLDYLDIPAFLRRHEEAK